MTFYNVISALLFVGAIQQVLLAIAERNVARCLMAVTLAALVFNDALYTSHVVEAERTVIYKLPLMLIDLLGFCLLAAAIAVLNPKQNGFQADLSPLFATDSDAVRWRGEGVFWMILGTYWLSVMWWTKRAGKYAPGYPKALLIADGVKDYPEDGVDKVPYPRTLLLLSALVAVTFLLMGLVAWMQWNFLATVVRMLAPAYFLAYVGLLRPDLLAEWRTLQLRAIEAASAAPSRRT